MQKEDEKHQITPRSFCCIQYERLDAKKGKKKHILTLIQKKKKMLKIFKNNLVGT